MKTIFEFLYYCLYRMFALIKRVGERDENLASQFYSGLLTTNFFCFLFFLKFVINLSTFNEWLLKGGFFSLFIVSYIFCNIYFIKKQNYIRIINNYDLKYPDKKNILATVGIIYSMSTFLSFIILVSIISKIKYYS